MSQKFYHTACCIIPPQELWPQIQQIRSKYDSAFNRWMPHINLLFPFIHQTQFPEEAQKLKKVLSNIKPFKVHLEQFQHFEHGRKCVMWLQPIDTDSNDSTCVIKLQKVVEGIFPHCSDTSRVYNPHLTLGQFDKKEIERMKNEFKKEWEPIEFMVDKVYFISRDGQSTPMHIEQIIPLEGE